jgi:SNF2 family DNA or RNA helicase
MFKQLKPLWSSFEYKEHQVIGVNWMLSREEEGTGGLLCDDMGLGKTIQMAGLLKNGVKKIGEESLLIAPVAVLEQWKSVLKKASMNIYVPSTSGMSWRLEHSTANLLAPRVYVIGYESALRKTVLINAYTWTRVIYDEAHRLGSNNTSTKLALLLKTKYVWLLTGTPIVNKVRDLVVLLEIAGIKAPKTSSLELLAPVLKKYVMARSMEQLRKTIPDAPPKPAHKTISMDFSTEEEKEFYDGMTGIICRRWKALEADGGGALEKIKLFMRLRQLSLHPQVYISSRKAALKSLYTRADWAGSSTKFDMLKKIICESTESHKWIVFCHFHQEMDMLQDMFRTESNVDLVQQYHGGLNAAAKQDVLNRTHMPLMEGKQEILLVQLQSGGTGLNLQHFDQIIFTGPWWTKALMDQAVGRAVRIGQKKVVTVYNLCLKAENALNIDTYMIDKANTKGDLCRKVLETANTTVSLPSAKNAPSE